MSRTKTSSFGVSSREGHDSSGFYGRNLYRDQLPGLHLDRPVAVAQGRSVPAAPPDRWADQVYCHTATDMQHIPDGSVALAFTSPPYNTGKDFDQDLDLQGYFDLIGQVAAEVYRVLQPGGRYLVNISNIGRKPYIPLTAYYYAIHMGLGFLPAGEIVWRKGKGMNGSCAWGSWRSAKAPRLRDVHESVLVLAKERFDRPDRGDTNIPAPEFMAGTLSVWDIQPESAKRIGHPAPFPLELAARAVKLFSYVGDVVLDPFNGSGTTCVAALEHGRHYVGYDISPEYVDLANNRLAGVREHLQKAAKRSS